MIEQHLERVPDADYDVIQLLTTLDLKGNNQSADNNNIIVVIRYNICCFINNTSLLFLFYFRQ